jgi:hypothetical protein
MSSIPTRPVMDTRLVQDKPKTCGFLHIVRHGEGPATMYVVTYHFVDHASNHAQARPNPMLAEGAQPLIELLEELGVDIRLGEVRGALKDVLRFGSANIPDMWFNEAEILQKSRLIASRTSPSSSLEG